ncbi:MAG: hypothetical protein O7G85_15680 [Planctomycetota bacterium]|nr:hypothetical protein [Planctomycetota bacterium]
MQHMISRSQTNYLLNIVEKEASSDSPEAVIAIIFAVCALETFINEVHEFVKSSVENWSKAVDFENEYLFIEVMDDLEWSRASLLKKYVVGKRLLTLAHYDKGKKSYADMVTLIDLRNAIIHLKPITMKMDDEGIPKHSHKDLLKKLMSNNLIKRVDLESKELINWIALLQDGIAATWALDIACRTIEEFLGSIKKEPFKTFINMVITGPAKVKLHNSKDVVRLDAED